jgi:transcriptional regulator with GAF, ATPase, and Fis domain
VPRGAFRSDLYFRLNIFPVHVPPLRDRRDDIPLLAQHFVREFRTRIGRQIERVDADALDRLTAYDWPGNVRELANILERAVILCRGPVLLDSHICLPAVAGPAGADEVCSLDEAERRHIVKALERAGGVIAGPRGAARMLGLNRSTLWSRMKKLGMPLTSLLLATT